jgi:intraflagellar transport protein 56
LFILDDVNEAYNLIKDLEPTTPQEYILKGVVNAALGQEQGSVSINTLIF